jgi:cytoskeletal protein CcmA (bactofilin family)
MTADEIRNAVRKPPVDPSLQTPVQETISVPQPVQDRELLQALEAALPSGETENRRDNNGPSANGIAAVSAGPKGTGDDNSDVNGDAAGNSISNGSGNPVGAEPASGDRILVVGNGVRFANPVTGCGHIDVFGQIETDFEGECLFVSDTGMFRGTATVERAEIRGHADGDIRVSGRLRVCAGARIGGRIRYGSLQIEPGATIEGSISLNEK